MQPASWGVIFVQNSRFECHLMQDRWQKCSGMPETILATELERFCDDSFRQRWGSAIQY